MDNPEVPALALDAAFVDAIKPEMSSGELGTLRVLDVDLVHGWALVASTEFQGAGACDPSAIVATHGGTDFELWNLADRKRDARWTLIGDYTDHELPCPVNTANVNTAHSRAAALGLDPQGRHEPVELVRTRIRLPGEDVAFSRSTTSRQDEGGTGTAGLWSHGRATYRVDWPMTAYGMYAEADTRPLGAWVDGDRVVFIWQQAQYSSRGEQVSWWTTPIYTAGGG